MKTLVRMMVVLALIAVNIKPATAQQSKADKKASLAADVKQMIDSKKFTFQANNMYPAYGGLRYLNTTYDVTVTADSVISYLPYFGEVYSGAGYNSSTDNGIKFTSTDFDYKSQQAKNGSWNVVIKPKDVGNATQLLFTVQTNGRTDLAVISQNRQRIRFDGYLKEQAKK